VPKKYEQSRSSPIPLRQGSVEIIHNGVDLEDFSPPPGDGIETLRESVQCCDPAGSPAPLLDWGVRANPAQQGDRSIG